MSFGTWRWVNRRNSRPFAVVLLGLGIVTVLVLASASYAACPDAGLSTGWSVVTRVVGLLTNNYAIDMFAAPGCDTGGVPLALQFARLTQLIVLLVAATSALTALLRTQVDRVAVRWSPRLSVVARRSTPPRRRCCPPWPRTPTATRSRCSPRTRWRPWVGPGPRGGVAGGGHRPAPGRDAGPAARPPAPAGTPCAGWPCWLPTAPRRSG